MPEFSIVGGPFTYVQVRLCQPERLSDRVGRGVDKDERDLHVAPANESCNPLNARLNPICHLQTLLRAHDILRVSRIRVKGHCLPGVVGRCKLIMWGAGGGLGGAL